MAAEVLVVERDDLSERIARDLTHVVVALTGEQAIDEFLTTYINEVRSLIPCQAVGIYLHRGPGQAPVFRATGVSEDYLELYEEMGRSIDPVLEAVMASGEPQVSSEVMPLESWLQSAFYRNVLSLYGLQSTMKAPILAGGRIIGALNFGDRDPEFFSSRDHRALTAALGAIVGLAVTGLLQQDALRRQRDHLAAAVDLSDRAIVVSDTRTGWRYVNAGARRLLAHLDASKADEIVGSVLATARGVLAGGATDREVVPLGDELPELSIRAYNPGKDRALVVAVIDEPGRNDVITVDVPALSPRERQIAAFVALGMHDQQIADQLVISVHTVKQHLKSIYRKLGVTSRVELARAVLMRRGPTASPAAE